MIPEKIQSKLVIVGSGRTIRLYSPSEGWEVWGNNNIYSVVEKPDRWFEIHQISKEKKMMKEVYYRRGKKEIGTYRPISIEKYLLQLDKLGIPVFMRQKNELIKQSIEFPFEEIYQNFIFHYFTCTFCWQLALAIMMGYEEIALYGVDLEDYWERKYQRPAVEYWLGLAQGMGIEIKIPLDSSLLKGAFQYGAEPVNFYE